MLNANNSVFLGESTSVLTINRCLFSLMLSEFGIVTEEKFKNNRNEDFAAYCAKNFAQSKLEKPPGLDFKEFERKHSGKKARVKVFWCLKNAFGLFVEVMILRDRQKRMEQRCQAVDAFPVFDVCKSARNIVFVGSKK
jgi:hypothetical protein